MVKTLSTSEIAKLCGFGVRSVAGWVDQGLLKAGKTPGGHRRIEVKDLVDFLRRQGLPVPSELGPSAPKILIVDDEEAVTRLIAEELKEICPDYEVRLAYDGFAAGDLVGSWKPDVVLLDLRMPDLNGFEVCRRIMAKEDAAGTAVIAMTAYYSPEAEEEILECGARACLAKPPDMVALLDELESALRAGGSRTGALPAAVSESVPPTRYG